MTRKRLEYFAHPEKLNTDPFLLDGQVVSALNAEDYGDRDAQEQNSTSGDRQKAVSDTAHGGLRFFAGSPHFKVENY